MKIRIDYGNGVVRYFSRRSIRGLRRYLNLSSITRRQLREATREWAESIPPAMEECCASRFGRDFSDSRAWLKDAGI